jgi:3'-phosphoadenosine 5'-phosphosulfate sulfotransferase
LDQTSTTPVSRLDEIEQRINQGYAGSNQLDEIEKRMQGGYTSGSVLDDIQNRYSLDPVQIDLPPQQKIRDYSKKIYSEKDLTKPEYLEPIRAYMVDRFGDHMRDEKPEDLVEKFTNNMRGFAGGNSVRSVNEISYLNDIGKDETKMARAGEAYALFEGMQSMFGETSIGEKAEIFGDYARSAVLDPINLMGFGIGKVASSGGFKAGSQVALIAAKKTFQKKLAEGATKEVAQEAAERVIKAQALRASRDTARRVAKKQAVERATSSALGRITTKAGLKELAVVGGFEGAVGAATDYMYQDALIRTKVQDEYNVYQTGISALGGIVAGGIAAAGSRTMTDPTRLAAPDAIQLKSSTRGAKVNLFRTQDESGKPFLSDVGDWAKDIQKGVELEAQDTEFFITMLLGNDELGLKGLVHTLSDQGYVWSRRNADDKISNWIGDIIKNADPQDAKQFIDDFTNLTGIDMATKTEKLTVENFADTFKRKMSDTGKVLNAASQAARFLGKNPNNLTVNDYAEFVTSGVAGAPETVTSTTGKKIGQAFGKVIEKDLPDFQNNVIRLLVANLSTTALNIGGYTAATSLNTAQDVVASLLMSPAEAVYKVYNPREASKLGLNFSEMVANQKFKLRNTLDVNTTYDTFLKYTQARPDATKELTKVLPGGIEDIKKLDTGFDPDVSMMTLRTNQAVDVIQRVNLVQAQDMYTKSIEFTTQLDKYLRRDFGMGWNDFFTQKNYRQVMQTEKFAKAEAAALDETLKAVFSKSYKGKNAIGEIAGVIEDARNLPGVGLLVPFGRFFNNTVGFTMDTVGIAPFVARTMGKNPTRTLPEQLARTGVAVALVGTLAVREVEYLEKGLSWSEEIDPDTGAVIDEKYEFPYGLLKATARVVAHLYRDESVPPDLLAQLGDQFVGQLTRQLGEVGDGVAGIFEATLTEEGKGLAKYLIETGGAFPAQIAAGATRSIDPLNVGYGMFVRREEFAVPDRAQSKLMADSLRYMNQFYAGITGEDIAPEKQTAASGTARADFSKFISTTRENRLTATERVVNQLGIPAFKLNQASPAKAANNRFNQIFHEILEGKAQQLLNSKSFREGTLEFKRDKYNDIKRSARDSVKDFMTRIAMNNGDRDLLKMIELSSKDRLTLNNTMRDLGFEGRTVDELSSEELDTLDNALKFRREFIGSKGIKNLK